jgi:hypothetical protein
VIPGQATFADTLPMPGSAWVFRRERIHHHFAPEPHDLPGPRQLAAFRIRRWPAEIRSPRAPATRPR